MDNSLVERALQIAIEAHKDQRRKSDGSPYIAHPIMVAYSLLEQGFSQEVIAAGLLHDVLEDTPYPAEGIEKLVGKKVLDIVRAVSYDETLTWEEKKDKYIETLRNSSIEAKAVSIADKIHNLRSLLDAHSRFGPIVWDRFNRGKEKKMAFEVMMLKMFKETWDNPMIEEYEKLIEQANKLS
jgi:(p)ppGpp synthase/HD superfamily hydrolase